jgi:predicted  nucleic acid-binding Zn-ribbon protein
VSEFSSFNGKLIYKEIKSRDVTSEFIDLETRLVNKRKYLEKYRDLLRSAKNVKDILEIENEIRELEEEIESTVGQLKYLKDLVGYSTLDLVVTKKRDFKYTPEAKDSFVERLKESVSNGWTTLVNFILMIFRLWPIWLVLPILIFLLRKYRKNRKLKK